MSFEIIVKETKTVKKYDNPEWKVLDTEEVARDSAYFSHSDDEPRSRIKDVYGYSPEVQKTVIETSEVFRQSVEDLDLAEVIKAVNNI